jgi:GTP-binding protein YchF
MALQVGIVGLPNVGKSTLFNALTGSSVAAENFPFTTVDPNVGVVVLEDERLDRIAEIARPESVVPAAIEFVDIAGLVRGASHGEGLGNRFLARIREVDAIAHVVRCFDDADVAHVHGSVDPVADAEVVETELLLADAATAEAALERVDRRARVGDAGARADAEAYRRLLDRIGAGTPARVLPAADRHVAASLFLLTAIPMVYVANVAHPEDESGSHVAALQGHAAAGDAALVVVAAQIEAEIAQLDPADRRDFLVEMGATESGLQRLARAAFRILELGTFFTTAGGREARAWPFPEGTTAAEAAGMIHTDFQRGFVRAEVVEYEDYVGFGGEHGAREAGRLRVEGRDYLINDGDVIRFRHNP